MALLSHSCINGHITASAEATISISDLALHRGVAVFDYFNYDHGQNSHVDLYMDRLYRSVSLAGLAFAIERDELLNMIHEVYELNGTPLCNIKVIVTGGNSPNGYQIGDSANIIILSYDKVVPDPRLYRTGAKLITTHYPRVWPEIKSINYFATAIMQSQMAAANAIDILHVVDGQLRETSRSNIYIVKNGVISTPKDDVLWGVTRQRLINSKAVELRDISWEETLDADEIFITSTTKGIMPIVDIDDHTIGSGVVGPISQSLQQQWIDAAF